jgi:hypothetical protein
VIAAGSHMEGDRANSCQERELLRKCKQARSHNEARKQGRNIRVAKLPMNSVVRALEIGETRGLMKAVVDADTQQILGCAILG